MFPSCSLASFLNRSDTVLSAVCIALALAVLLEIVRKGKTIYLLKSTGLPRGGRVVINLQEKE